MINTYISLHILSKHVRVYSSITYSRTTVREWFDSGCAIWLCRYRSVIVVACVIGVSLEIQVRRARFRKTKKVTLVHKFSYQTFPWNFQMQHNNLHITCVSIYAIKYNINKNNIYTIKKIHLNFNIPIYIKRQIFAPKKKKKLLTWKKYWSSHLKNIFRRREFFFLSSYGPRTRMSRRCGVRECVRVGWCWMQSRDRAGSPIPP